MPNEDKQPNQAFLFDIDNTVLISCKDSNGNIKKVLNPLMICAIKLAKKMAHTPVKLVTFRNGYDSFVDDMVIALFERSPIEAASITHTVDELHKEKISIDVVTRYTPVIENPEKYEVEDKEFQAELLAQKKDITLEGIRKNESKWFQLFDQKLENFIDNKTNKDALKSTIEESLSIKLDDATWQDLLNHNPKNLIKLTTDTKENRAKFQKLFIKLLKIDRPEVIKRFEETARGKNYTIKPTPLKKELTKTEIEETNSDKGQQIKFASEKAKRKVVIDDDSRFVTDRLKLRDEADGYVVIHFDKNNETKFIKEFMEQLPDALQTEARDQFIITKDKYRQITGFSNANEISKVRNYGLTSPTATMQEFNTSHAPTLSH